MKTLTVLAAMTLCVSMGLAKGREDFVSISGNVGEVAFVSQELTFSLSGKIRVVDNSVVTATRTVTGYLVTVSPASKLVATVPEVFHWTGSSVPALVAGLEGRYSARNKNMTHWYRFPPRRASSRGHVSIATGVEKRFVNHFIVQRRRLYKF